MLKKTVLTGIFFLIVSGLCAQIRPPLLFDIFSNATTLPTRPREIFSPIHPGITIGTALRYKKSGTHYLSGDSNFVGQTVKIGFLHHRYVQSAVQIYSEFNYSYRLNPRIGLDVLVGGGYTHSFPAHQIFVFQNGNYERKLNLGKPGLMGTFAIGAGYFYDKTIPMRIFIHYQFWLKSPFINEYVPVLPGTALHIGVATPLFDSPHTFTKF